MKSNDGLNDKETLETIRKVLGAEDNEDLLRRVLNLKGDWKEVPAPSIPQYIPVPVPTGPYTPHPVPHYYPLFTSDRTEVLGLVGHPYEVKIIC